MADKGGSSFMPIVLLGGAGYLAYKLFMSPATTAAQASGTPTPPAASPGVNPPAAGSASSPASPAPAQSAYNSLDATFQRFSAQVQSNASDPAITSQQGTYIATPSVFNYYLAQVSSFNLDSTGMAAAFPGGDVPMSLGAFWSAASGYLAKSKGLSGWRGQGMAGLILSRGRR